MFSYQLGNWLEEPWRHQRYSEPELKWDFAFAANKKEVWKHLYQKLTAMRKIIEMVE